MSQSGSELYDSDSLGQSSDSPENGPPNLLTLPPDKAAKELIDLWAAQDPIMNPREARWEVNDLRRQGYVNVRAVRSQDSARVTVRIPLGGRPVVELFNKARTLCRTFGGVILADPPVPQTEPTSDTEEDRDAAEVTQRALDDLLGPDRLNAPQAIRGAVDKACTYGSGFVRVYVDPMGGGKTPRTLMASPHPNATATDPLHDPTTQLPHGALIPDPNHLDPSVPPPMVMTEPPEPMERYVHADGQALTDDPARAIHDWVPDLKREILTGKQVRFIPHTASLADAHGVLLASYITLGQAKRMFPEVADLKPEEQKALTAYQPTSGEKLLPKGQRKARLEGDEALVFCLTGIWTECDEYPDGAYVVALGDSQVPYRETWCTETPKGKACLPIPVAQFGLFSNGQDDPYLDGLMDDLGGVNELRAAAVGLMMQHADKWGNMPVFVPAHSTLTDNDLYGKKTVRVMPGSEPKGIPVPPIDPALGELFGLSSAEMDSASHLQQAAQGVEGPDVKSGRHAYQIIAQVHAQLSEPAGNIADGAVRLYRIVLELARAFGIEGEARWTGEDGDYKYQRWQGSDLGGDVRIKPGTMTMLSPAMKAQVIMDQVAAQMLTADEAKEMLAHGIGTVLGQWDNPFRVEIRRSLSLWEQGPPDGWTPPTPQPQAVPGQVIPTPQGVIQGPPSVQMALVPDPNSVALEQQVFAPAPHHMLPGVAQLRVTEMSRTMASSKYVKQPPQWRAVLDAEFQRAAMAAAPPPPTPAGHVPGQPDQGGTPQPAPTGPDPRTGQPPLDPPHQP